MAECCDNNIHSSNNPRGFELYWHSIICDNLHFSLNGSEYLGSHKYYLFSEKEGWVVDVGSMYDDRAAEPWGMFPQAAANSFPSKILKISFATTITTHHTKTLPYSLGMKKHCNSEECINAPSELGDLVHWFVEISDIELIDECFEVWEIYNSEDGDDARRITTYTVSDANKVFYKIESGNSELNVGGFITYLKGDFPWGFKNPAGIVFQAPSCLDTDKRECDNHIRLFETKNDYCNSSLKDLLDGAPDNDLKAVPTGRSTDSTLEDYPISIKDRRRVGDLGGFYRFNLTELDESIISDLEQGMTEEDASVYFEKNKGRLRAEKDVNPQRRPVLDGTEYELENRIDDYEFHIQIVEGAPTSPSPSASASPLPSPSYGVISISPRFCECLEVTFTDNPERENMNGIYQRVRDDCTPDFGTTLPDYGTFEKIGNPLHVIRKRGVSSTACQWHLIDLEISGAWPAQNRAATNTNQRFDCSICPCPADFDWVAPGGGPTVEVVPCPSPSPSLSPGVSLSASPSVSASASVSPFVSSPQSQSPSCYLYRICLSPSPTTPSPSPSPGANREYRICSPSPSVSPISASPAELASASPSVSPEASVSASPLPNRSYILCSPSASPSASPFASPTASPFASPAVVRASVAASPSAAASPAGESPVAAVVYVPCSPSPSPQQISSPQTETQPSATGDGESKIYIPCPGNGDGNIIVNNNITAPIIKVNGICYYYGGQTDQAAQVNQVQKSYYTCGNCQNDTASPTNASPGTEGQLSCPNGYPSIIVTVSGGDGNWKSFGSGVFSVCPTTYAEGSLLHSWRNPNFPGTSDVLYLQAVNNTISQKSFVILKESGVGTNVSYTLTDSPPRIKDRLFTTYTVNGLTITIQKGPGWPT